MLNGEKKGVELLIFQICFYINKIVTNVIAKNKKKIRRESIVKDEYYLENLSKCHSNRIQYIFLCKEKIVFF